MNAGMKEEGEQEVSTPRPNDSTRRMGSGFRRNDEVHHDGPKPNPRKNGTGNA
jgi:hypothetical protein